MKKEIRLLTLLAFVSALVHGLNAHAAPSLSIQPLSGDSADVEGWQPAIGAGVSEMILESLEKSNARIQVVDNNGVGVLKSTAADYILSGDVTEFMTDTNIGSMTAFFAKAHLATKSYTAHVAIAWRITDASGQRIIRRGTAFGIGSGSLYPLPGTPAAASQTAADKSKKKAAKKKKDSDGTSDNASNDSSSTATAPMATGKTNSDLNIGYSNLEFMDSALGKAADTTVSNVVAQLSAMSFGASDATSAGQTLTGASSSMTGKIIAVTDNGAIIVSVGSNAGFKVGDELGVYQPTDFKDGTGKVVYTDETLVGTITLQSVQEDRSRGILSGNGPVHEGMTVKAK